MKTYKNLLGDDYVVMNDGKQVFAGGVVTAMQKVSLWDNFYQCYRRTHNGTDFFLSIGENASFFKSDGQRYCVQLHIARGNDCYLSGCFCVWRQNDIQPKLFLYHSLIDELIKSGFDFEKEFSTAFTNYPWQTSKDKEAEIVHRVI